MCYHRESGFWDYLSEIVEKAEVEIKVKVKGEKVSIYLMGG